MTNLIEKSLLLGFGIFTLTIFSSILIPFLGTIVEFNQNGRNELEDYMFFINEIDQGINHVIENQDETYLRNIEYPSNLNLTLYSNIARYEFLIENQLCVKIKEYDGYFVKQNFQEITPGSYLLNISHYLSFIKINLIILY
ncbi:MAG: hypothetical protein ACFFA4_01635 [Promethearchaeota archaeon]